MRLISSRLLSQLSVAQLTVLLAIWLALGGDASLVVGIVTVRVVILELRCTTTNYAQQLRTVTMTACKPVFRTAKLLSYLLICLPPIATFADSLYSCLSHHNQCVAAITAIATIIIISCKGHKLPYLMWPRTQQLEVAGRIYSYYVPFLLIPKDQ